MMWMDKSTGQKEVPLFKVGNQVVLMIGFTEFHAGIQTKHIRK